MKKITKGYCVVSALLVLWAIVDFFHYAQVGKDLIAHYQGASVIQRLVRNTLFHGIVKILLCVLVILIGLWRSNAKCRIRSMTAITLRLGAALLALWLVCMAAFTYGTAQYVFVQLTGQGYDLAGYAARIGQFDSLFSDDAYYAARRARPGALEYAMNQTIAGTGASVYSPSLDVWPQNMDTLSVYRGDVEGECETAVAFFNTDGEVLRTSGDFVYFSYVTDACWREHAESAATSGYGWLNLSDPDDERYLLFRSIYAGVHSLYDMRAIRMTGYFDGSRFEPLAMAYMTDGMYYSALDAAAPGWDTLSESAAEETESVIIDGNTATVSASGGSITPPYTMSELDEMGLIEWEVRFDHTADAGRELVTIYATNSYMTLYEPSGSVRYQGVEVHEDLRALLGTMGFYATSGQNTVYSGASQFDLWDLIVFSSYLVYDSTSDDAEPLFSILTALRASPLRIAMRFLQTVYLVSFALALVSFWLLRRSLKKNLVAPIQAISQGIASGWTHLFPLREKPPRWAESYTLYQQYEETLSRLQQDKDELSRLNTALAYARTAEQNRRQMTSHIAHELKTPLAIVHSYAEGLKEHIADDKRDRYLDVILTESERMDKMVLEMLDLSRLEAGRVKLTRDVFSLRELTHAVFDRLERAAAARQLTIVFDCPDACVVTADEARIGQVVENFATNAVKYTPTGGHIAVHIRPEGDGAVFSIENDSEPLSSEAISKVWDSFYRTDEARTGGGSGLGLAIARRIIDLHGGTCSVRNTASGVEFSFRI